MRAAVTSLGEVWESFRVQGSGFRVGCYGLGRVLEVWESFQCLGGFSGGV